MCLRLSKQAFSFSLLLLFIGFIGIQKGKAEKKLTANKGKIQLSFQDIEKGVPLDGEWEFYWQQLLAPQDFAENNFSQKNYYSFPSVWNGLMVNKQELSGKGYATFHLTVDVPKVDELLALEVGAQYNSYKIWINGKIFAQNGKVGTSLETSKPQWLPITKAFFSDTTSLEIIFQISNFRHAKGGIYLSPVLGTYKNLDYKRELAVAVNFTTFGCLLLIGLFFLGMYLFWRNDKSLLYFALFCITISYRFIGTESYILTSLFPNISWVITAKIEYISLYIGVALMMTFISQLFPRAVHILAIRILQYFTVGLVVFTLIFPISIYSYIITPYQIIVFASLFYGAFICVKAQFLKYDGAIFAVISLFILLSSTAVGSLSYLEVLPHFPFAFQLGFLGFVFSQTFILSFRFSRAFHQVETLKEETLLQKNDIESQNGELVQQKEEILQQQEEIIAINDALHTKNQHIMDSIRYAKTIQNAFLPQESQLENAFDDHFVLFKPKDVVSGDFYWVKEIGNKLFFAVGDCTGHGVPGAFMSIVGISLLNEIVEFKKIHNPSEILKNLDARVVATLKQNDTTNEDGMDIGICVVEKNTDNNTFPITFSGAKFAFSYTENNAFKRISGTRRGIGGTAIKKEKKPFEIHQITLTKGSCLYFTSDGFIDQNDSKRKRFSSVRFYRELQQLINLPMKQQALGLEKVLEKHQKEEAQRDDITVMGVRL